MVPVMYTRQKDTSCNRCNTLICLTDGCGRRTLILQPSLNPDVSLCSPQCRRNKHDFSKADSILSSLSVTKGRHSQAPLPPAKPAAAPQHSEIAPLLPILPQITAKNTGCESAVQPAPQSSLPTNGCTPGGGEQSAVRSGDPLLEAPALKRVRTEFTVTEGGKSEAVQNSAPATVVPPLVETVPSSAADLVEAGTESHSAQPVMLYDIKVAQVCGRGIQCTVH